MADILDRIQKLVALTMNNPDIEESRSAARLVVAMIVEHNITLNDKAAMQFEMGARPKSWAPDDEFEKFWKEAGAGVETDGVDPDLHDYGRRSQQEGLKAAIVDTDLDDDFMRKRIKVAWKALTRERARLKREIEQEYHQRFQKPYPRPEPVDWEKP